jgi:hypothetical protein
MPRPTDPNSAAKRSHAENATFVNTNEELQQEIRSVLLESSPAGQLSIFRFRSRLFVSSFPRTLIDHRHLFTCQVSRTFVARFNTNWGLWDRHHGEKKKKTHGEFSECRGLPLTG